MIAEKTKDKYAVSASENFVRILKNLPTTPPFRHPEELPDQLKVAKFIQDYLSSGWDQAILLGKNISSDNVPTGDPKWLEKVQYAQKNNLFHYHIGIPFYKDSGNGYLTSEYVIHYQQLSENEIKLVDLGWHPPLNLPTEDDIKGDIKIG